MQTLVGALQIFYKRITRRPLPFSFSFLKTYKNIKSGSKSAPKFFTWVVRFDRFSKLDFFGQTQPAVCVSQKKMGSWALNFWV